MEPGHPVMNGMGNKEISLEKKKQQQGYSINFSTLVGRDRKKNFVTFFLPFERTGKIFGSVGRS